MSTVGLVVPVLSNFKGFTELMTSVDVPVELVVIDNWNVNWSVSKSWNAGLERLLHLDVVVVVNDDVKFYPGTIEKLVEAIHGQENDLISAVGSDTGQDDIKYDGFPDYCCFALNPEWFTSQYGWFDENFVQAYFEDNDMHYRLKLGGGLTGMHLGARVEHEGSVTQFKGGTDKENRVVSHETFRMNEEYYIAKWGGRPGEETFDTPFNRGGNLWDW